VQMDAQSPVKPCKGRESDLVRRGLLPRKPTGSITRPLRDQRTRLVVVAVLVVGAPTSDTGVEAVTARPAGGRWQHGGETGSGCGDNECKGLPNRELIRPPYMVQNGAW
jgi:hypothetical protein